MNQNHLKEKLLLWIDRETWHTSHPFDIKRFNTCLKNIFEQFGYSISRDYFKTAISELIDEYHSNFDSEYKIELIDEYATKAESITDYLKDTTS